MLLVYKLILKLMQFYVTPVTKIAPSDTFSKKDLNGVQVGYENLY